MDTQTARTSESTGDVPKSRKVRKLPPLVLPDGDQESDDYKLRLLLFTATSSAFKWDDSAINAKTKKFLARNGFHQLVWTGILLDQQLKAKALNEWFDQNIVRIGDDQFEATFGMPLDTTAAITTDQLLANLFLLFALPAKSHTKYLHEWAQRRLDAFKKNIPSEDPILDQKLEFVCHPELFVATKRRFYVYKQLVPKLTRYAMEYAVPSGTATRLQFLFIQIRLAIIWSGLELFRWSYEFYQALKNYYEVGTIDRLPDAVKQDIQRLIAARQAIVDKYGENDLPFARLLDYPEVCQLDRRHYPDLAVCAHAERVKNGSQTIANVCFRRLATKTPNDELVAKATTFNVPQTPIAHFAALVDHISNHSIVPNKEPNLVDQNQDNLMDQLSDNLDDIHVESVDDNDYDNDCYNDMLDEIDDNYGYSLDMDDILDDINDNYDNMLDDMFD